MSSTADANQSPIADEPQDRPELGPPRAWPLLYWLNRPGSVRYRYRLLQGLALGLAIDECTVFWLASHAELAGPAQVRLLASTLFWSVLLGIVAGWVLLGGWFDEPTRGLLTQLGQRRGYAASVCQNLETMASWRWLAGLLAFPSLVFTVVAAVRATHPMALGASVYNLLLALLFTQLVAAAIIGAVVALRSLEPKRARQVWLFACVLPELLRPVLPGLPTLSTLAITLEQTVLRWGAGG